MNFEYMCSSIEIGQTKLDLTIQAARSHEGRIQCIWSICSHQHFDVSTRIETIQLINQLQHSTLYFVVAASTIVKTSTTDCVNFIEKDETRLFGTGHFEKFTDHTGTLTNVFLHQLGADNTDEAGVSSVGHSTGAQCFSSAGWSEQQDTLWRLNTEVYEFFGLLKKDLILLQ